jgi:type VI secretion system protein ImpG
MRLALIDPDFTPDAPAGGTLSTDLTCSNRDLPLQLRIGQAGGDLVAQAGGALCPLHLLRAPSRSYQFASSDGAHWRLIAHLSLGHAGLTTPQLADLQKMLDLYNLPQAPDARRRIEGIVGLAHGAVRAWMRTHPVSTLMPGVAIRITLDEAAFSGSAIAVFGEVMARYFSLNSQLNCFTRLTLVSQQTGEELFTCAPQTGEALRP